MDNISNSELNSINKFFQDFTGSVERILSEKFDESIFEFIDFSVMSVSQISSTDDLKENNVLYKFNYVVEGIKGHGLVLIPEEFVAISADLLMGGNAKDVYKGSLGELEINAALNLFNSLLDDMKITFKSLYFKDLIISSGAEIIAKESNKYTEILNNIAFDFSIIHSLNLGKEEQFAVTFLTNAAIAKQILINIEVLEEPMIAQGFKKIKPKELEGFADISNIADIKINIEAELGRIKIPIKQVLGLVGGSIIELDTHDNADIKVFANGLEVAKAQVVVVDEHFGIKITKIISPEERYKDL